MIADLDGNYLTGIEFTKCALILKKARPFLNLRKTANNLATRIENCRFICPPRQSPTPGREQDIVTLIFHRLRGGSFPHRFRVLSRT